MDVLGDPKAGAMPEPWDTCQGELLTGSGTSPRETCAAVNEADRSSENYCTEMQSLEMTRCLWSGFGPVFLCYYPLPMLGNDNVYPQPLYDGSM